VPYLLQSRIPRGATIVALFVALSAPGLVASQSAEDDAAVYSRQGADSCFACHDDQQTLALFRTKHAAPGDPQSPFGHGQLQCESCHGPSGDHAGRVRRNQVRPPTIDFGSDAATPVPVQNQQCLNCHAGDEGLAWHASGHDNDEVACADCHVSHAARDPVMFTATQPEVCFGCHQYERSQAMKPYSHPFRQGKMDCSGCHDPHGNSTDTLFARQTLTDTCYDCHAEKRGPYLWEHAPVAEDCSNCHDPHGSNNPGMVSLRGPMMCQGCHSQAGHPSFANSADGLADGTPSAFLLGRNCMNCHTQVHGSNHPSGSKLMR
jgi:DmsE family decaheme c-type cytochrome